MGTKFTRVVSNRIAIDEPPARIWKVLCDLDRYGEWHPHIRAAKGEIAVGRKVEFSMAPPGRRAFTIRPVVIKADQNVELRLLGRLPGVFSGEHRYLLAPAGAGDVTWVEQSEHYRGLLVPLIGRTIRATAAEFEEANQALKARVEAVDEAPDTR